MRQTKIDAENGVYSEAAPISGSETRRSSKAPVSSRGGDFLREPLFFFATFGAAATFA